MVQAERHGIPQARHRLILLGVRDDLGAPVLSPEQHLPRVDEVPARKVLDGCLPVEADCRFGPAPMIAKPGSPRSAMRVIVAG